MISLLAFFLTLSSGGFYAAARFERRYEEAVPLTVFSVVELLFLFGLLNNLKLGFYAVCLAALALYALGVRQIVKQHSLRTVCKNLFTPGFFIFLLLSILCALLIVGRVAVQGDEFSYWATSVKKMWYLDKLPCVPEAEPSFIEYPPGMQLLEYLAIRFYGSFSEWRMNFAYLVYLLAMFLPFLRKLTHKRVFVNFLVCAVVLTAGSLIYADVYDNLRVDCALGMTYASAMASVFFLKKKDGAYDPLQVLSVVMAANMLVLTKAAGKLFAAMLLFALVLAVVREEGRALVRLPRRQKILGVFLVVFPFLTAWLWKLKYTQTPTAAAFNESAYDFGEFIRILLGADEGYRSEIRTSFITFITSQKNDTWTLPLTSLQFFLLLGALIFLAAAAWKKKDCGNTSTVWVLLGGVLVYWLGLMASYMYTFDEYEGTRLASMQRYLNIYQSALVLFLVFLLLSAPILYQLRNLSAYSLLLGLLLLVPPQPIMDFMSRTNVEASIATRAAFDVLVDQIRADKPPADGEKPSAAIIAQTDYPIALINHFYYLLYPDYQRLVKYTGYSTVPPAEGSAHDRWPGYMKICTPEEMRAYFEELGIDYLALYSLDDDFIAQYQSLFNAPLAAGQVYRITAGEAQFTLLQSGT